MPDHRLWVAGSLNFKIVTKTIRGQNIKHITIVADPFVLFGCLISEDEGEDFSKGAEGFVEAAKQRRVERQSDDGNNP